MLRTIFLFTMLAISVKAFAQNNYDKGFKAGYKEGYCYNDYGCTAPYPPVTPYPLIGESSDSYQDGYNRGFKLGLDDKQAKQRQSTTTHSSTYNSQRVPLINPVQNTLEKHVSPDFNFLLKAATLIQTRADQNREYRDKLIDWIFELKAHTRDKDFLDMMELHYKRLRALDNENFVELREKLDAIKFNIKEQIDNLNSRTKNEPNRLWDNGVSNYNKGNFKQAIEDFTGYIQLNPSYFNAYLYRGKAYYMEGDFLSALTDLNKYIENKEDDVYALEIRGWTKNQLKDYVGALSDFNKQISISPSALAYYNRGSVKSGLNENSSAIMDYDKAILIAPNFSMAYNNRAWVKFKQKKLSDALKDINKAIELDENNWVAYDSRQEIKFALGDYKGCIDDCDKALGLNSELLNARLFKGRAHYKLGNKVKACEEWRRVAASGSDKALEYLTKYCN